MTYRYPYRSTNKQEYSKLRNGQDYAIWQKPGLDIDTTLTELTNEIIEIGGPTESGFYFLDNAELPSKPIITNITQNPTASEDNEKEQAAMMDNVIDGRNLPYDNTSIGMFLMAGMSMTSDWYMELPKEDRDSKTKQIEMEFDIARLEMERVAIGTLEPTEVKYAQRIPIYLEMYRTLMPKGLLMTDGSLTEIKILQQIGFEIVAFTQEFVRPAQNWDGIYYEIVAQKP